MRGDLKMRWIVLGVVIAIGALPAAFSAAASAKAKKSKPEHVLITFSGSGNGQFSYSYPEDDVGDSPGTCTEPSESYTSTDHYTFEWSEKLTFPAGIGSYVKQYKVGGTDVTVQKQGTCTNGFGNILGGNSFDCTEDWNPLPSSDTEYPTITLFGPKSHLGVRTGGGVQLSGAPTGTNCVGQPVGTSLDSYSFEKLKGALSFSTKQFERKGSLSKPFGGNTAISCNATTCDQASCKDDISPPADVPLACSTQQSFTAELKVKLIK